MADPKKQQPKKVYFKINQSKSAVWTSDDGTINLSAPRATRDGVQALYGSIEIDDSNFTFKQVERSMQYGLIIQVTKKEYDAANDSKEKVEMVKLNGKIEKDGVMKRKADSVLKLKGEDGIRNIVKYLEGLNDASILSHMIQLENNGKKRSEVLHALDVADVLYFLVPAIYTSRTAWGK